MRRTAVLGADGTATASKTIWKGVGKERIDVENHNPGKRAGQLHYQDNDGNKYIFDPNSWQFFDPKRGGMAPKAIQNLLKDNRFEKAMYKGLEQYLGVKK
nr:hypothetical protein [Chromobacterium sp. ASV5]